MADEPIGSVSVQITGDYSALEQSFTAAQSGAQKAGEQIAVAFESAASGASAIPSAAIAVSAAVEDLAAKSGLAGGELNIFRAALQGSLEAGVPVNQALTEMAASSGSLGASVSSAAESLSREAVAATSAASANTELGGSFKTVSSGVESTDASFKQFADDVQNFISHPLKSAGEAAKEFILALGPMGVAAFAGAAAVAAIATETFNLVKAFGQTTEATQNMADRLNLTWRETRNLEEMAQIAGVSIGGLQQASFRLAESLDEDSKNGQKVAEALAKVGVSGATSGELLSNFLQKLADIPDDTQRIALAHEVLGRSSQQILPLIKNYGELQEAVQHLGPAIDSNVAQKLLASDDALDKLSISWSRLKERFAAFAAPGVEAFVNALTTLVSGDTMLTLDQQIGQIEAKMVSLGQKSEIAGWLLADGLTKGKDATLAELQAQRDLLVGREQANERSKEYNAEIAASNAAAAAASRAAKAAALEQYNAMLTFNNSIVDLWNSIPDTYDKYVSNLGEGGKTAKAFLGELTADINRGNTAMLSLSGAPLASVQKTVSELMTVREQVKSWAADDSWNELAVKVAGLGEKFAPQMEKILAAGGPVAERIADLMNAAPNAPDAMQGKGEFNFIEELLKIQKQVDDDTQKTGAHMQEMWEKYRGGAAKAQEAITPITALIHDRLPEAFIAAYDESMHLNESLKILGLTGVSAAGDIQSKWIIAFDDVITHARNLREVDAAWAQVGSKVDKLAKYDLPEAIRMQDEYIAALQRTSAPIMQIYDAQEKELQLEIQMKQQRGESANAEIIALENMRIKTGALKESTQLLGNLYVDLVKDFQHAYDALGNGIADSIVDGKNFWESWHKILHDLEKQILEQVVKTALHAIADALINNIGLAGKLGGILGGIFGGGGGMVGAGPIGGGVAGGLDAALGGGASVAGSVAGAGGKAAGAAGSAVSSLTGIIGAVGSVGTMISSIIGNFQNAKMETTMNHIEESTRYLMIGLVTQGDSLLNDSHTIRNTLTTFMAWNWGVATTYFQGISEKLDTIIGMGGIHPTSQAAVAKMTTEAASRTPSDAKSGGDIVVNIDKVSPDVTDAKVRDTFNRGIRLSKLAGAFRPGVFPQ